MTNEIRELNDAELDAVSGGNGVSAGFSLRQALAAGGGGQNDPAQMFQQILQQLTQGQG